MSIIVILILLLLTNRDSVTEKSEEVFKVDSRNIVEKDSVIDSHAENDIDKNTLPQEQPTLSNKSKKVLLDSVQPKASTELTPIIKTSKENELTPLPDTLSINNKKDTLSIEQ